MSKTLKINSISDNYSVRHPRNIWMVRMLVFIVLVSAVDVPGARMVEINQKPSEWANQWVAENNLNRELVPPQNSSDYKLLANKKIPHVKSVFVKEEVKNSLKLNEVGSASSTHSNKTIAKSELASLYLATHQISVLPVIEQELIAPEINYQAQITMAYSQMGGGNTLLKKSSNTFIVSGAIGPQYANGSINQPSGASYAKSSRIQDLQSETKGSIDVNNGRGYSAMFNMGMQLGSNFEIYTGINYSQLNGNQNSFYDSQVQKYQTIYTTINTASDDGSRSISVIESDVPYTNYFSDTLQSNYKISSLEIPLVVKYNFGKRKLSYFMSSGISTILGSSYTTNYQSNEIGEGTIIQRNYGFNTVNLLVGAGIQYQATSHIIIKFSPGYKYGIPVSETSTFQSKTSTFGLFTGLNYYFN